MANLPSVFQPVNDIEVGQDKPLTENLFTKLGSNDNYLNDQLNVEAATRAAADAAFAADISGNIKGPGPIQTLTTIVARLGNANQLQFVGEFSYITNAINTADLGQYVVTFDRGTLHVERLTGNAGTYTRQDLWDSGVAIGAFDIVEQRIEATSTNIFFKHRIFRWTALP